MTPHPLVDIGVNLTHKRFASDVHEVIGRAHQAGVQQLVITGTDLPKSREALSMATARRGGLYSTAGVHPHHASGCDEETLSALADLAKHESTVAIGECGLDYNRNYSPPIDQRRWFEAQVQLAARMQLPLFLHEREARADLLAILKRYRDNLPCAVVHCFTGSAEDLEAYIALDLHIGITGWICDERRGTHLQHLVARVPGGRLMLESDAPFLLPRDMPGAPKSRRNEPAFLPHVLKRVATSLGRAPAEVAESTTTTARHFFGLDG